MISTLQTPYLSILDGYARKWRNRRRNGNAITEQFALVGGAIGLFAHAPFRIATERTIFSMPEASIGLCPSSGASFFLPKLDGEIGTYLALTGSRVEGVDALLVWLSHLISTIYSLFFHDSYTGIATHYVPSARLNALEERLIDLETSSHEIIHRVIEEFVEPLSEKKTGFAQDVRNIIDRYVMPSYSFNTSTETSASNYEDVFGTTRWKK